MSELNYDRFHNPHRRICMVDFESRYPLASQCRHPFTFPFSRPSDDCPATATSCTKSIQKYKKKRRRYGGTLLDLTARADIFPHDAIHPARYRRMSFAPRASYVEFRFGAPYPDADLLYAIYLQKQADRFGYGRRIRIPPGSTLQSRYRYLRI